LSLALAYGASSNWEDLSGADVEEPHGEKRIQTRNKNGTGDESREALSGRSLQKNAKERREKEGRRAFTVAEHRRIWTVVEPFFDKSMNQ